jgi:hypothetical protein
MSGAASGIGGTASFATSNCFRIASHRLGSGAQKSVDSNELLATHGDSAGP